MTASWLVGLALTLNPAPELRVDYYPTLLKEYEAKRKALFQAYDAAADDARRQKAIYQDLTSNDLAYADRFFALAQEEPNGPAAPDALYKTLELQELQEGLLSPIGQRALDRLGRDFVTSPKLGGYLQQLSNRPWRGVEPLLRDVLARSPDRTARGHACFGLGTKLSAQATIPKLMNDPEMARKIREDYEPEQMDAILNQDVTAKLAEATALFQRVVSEFADVPLFPAYPQDDRTLGPLARSWLANQEALAIGKPAPEISGHDLDGQTFKLSDQRGKVVVVVFWASWCHGCIDQIPHERDLAAKLAGQPFALLGVNCDDTAEAARKAMKKYQVTWPNWYDGDLKAEQIGSGPIRESYHVQSIPLVLVLDDQGIIRARDPRGVTLKQAVEKLLKK